MKKSVKIYIKHELCIWFSLSLNVLISAVVCTIYLRNTSNLYLGIGLMVLCFSSGLLKIWREGNKKPGAGAIVIDYISLLTLSIIIFVVTLSKTSMLAIWCLVPAFIVEIIIILLVGRRNRLSDL